MFQIDERSLADGRTLVSIQPEKSDINRLLKSGTIDFTSKDNKLWLTTPAIRQAFLTKQGNIDDLFDRILTAVNGTTIQDSYEFRDDQKFLSSIDVGKDVVVRGNLSVLGNTTTVDTPTMTIEDNIIELNKNEKNQGITLRNAGTAINRGAKGFARYLYSEDFGGFVLNNSANIDGPIEDWTLVALTEDNGSFSKGDVRVKNRLYSPFARITDSLVVDQKTTTKDLEVTNTSIFGGETTFNNNVTINGILTTNGQVNFKNTVTAYKPVTFQDVATFNANVTMNKQLTNNGLVTMNKGLTVHDSNVLVDTGTLQVGGAVTFDSTLGVAGNTTINGALSVNNIITSNNTITGNDFVTQSHYFVSGGDGKGIRFWDKSDKYTIFMSSTAAAGQVEHANTSDYNMYFKMTEGTNRGFVFANGANPITQIEGSGIIRTVNDIYSKNSRVLTQADEGEGNHLDADTVDNKHARDLLWRDGSLPMLGNLQMAGYRIGFADNNDYLDFNDTAAINGSDRGGLFRFVSDDDVLKSIVEAGVFKAGQINIDNSNASINGLNYIVGSTGQAFKLSDAWIRVNEANAYSSGVYFNNSVVRTDKEFQIGDTGTTLRANADIFTYKGEKVLTQAGIETMHGNINMGAQKISFNTNETNGTAGAANTDYAYIYAEHDENSESSRLVLDISDNADDSIVLRTSNTSSTKKDSLKVDYNRATFFDNPYFGSNRLLHTGDMGSGNHLDADTVDGKHYSDLVAEFVNVAGDTMNGNLKMGNGSYITGGVSGQKVPIWAFTGYESFGLFYEEGSPDKLTINLSGVQPDTFKLVGDGTGFINNSKILTEAMEGHGKGIDSDTIDGQHLSDLDNRFVNVNGDTMTRTLKFKSPVNEIEIYNDNGQKARGMVFKNTGETLVGMVGCYYNEQVPEKMFIGNTPAPWTGANSLTVTAQNAFYNNSKILTEAMEGHGKGIDADTVDGQHLTDLDNRFVNASGDTMTGDLTITKTNAILKLSDPKVDARLVTNTSDSTVYLQAGKNDATAGKLTLSGMNARQLGSFMVSIENMNNATINSNKILTTADEGHTKNLDADTVDGKHATDFATAGHNHDDRYIAKNEVDLKNKYRIAYDESTNSLNFMYLG